MKLTAQIKEETFVDYGGVVLLLFSVHVFTEVRKRTSKTKYERHPQTRE